MRTACTGPLTSHKSASSHQMYAYRHGYEVSSTEQVVHSGKLRCLCDMPTAMKIDHAVNVHFADHPVDIRLVVPTLRQDMSFA